SNNKSTLFYNNTFISIKNFRNFGYSFVLYAKALYNKLIFNWLPRVDLNRVRDKISNIY
ncbi:hypothetical protein DL95DRAFT_320800, partial [Leptodontidium sp. 2 PMI_412]